MATGEGFLEYIISFEYNDGRQINQPLMTWAEEVL